jgi:hypothetical protein
MSTYQRPADATLTVERVQIEGTCDQCGAAELAAYEVLSEAGWESVVKCQNCLASRERSGWTQIGPVELLADAIVPLTFGAGS